MAEYTYVSLTEESIVLYKIKTMPIGRYRDLTGEKIGKLTVIRRICSSSGFDFSIWACQCDCGNKVVKKSYELSPFLNDKKKYPASCGCTSKFPRRSYRSHPEDLVGLRVGYLTVISRDMSKKCSESRWICRCDCGNEISRRKSDLIKLKENGAESSCGCMKNRSSKRVRDWTGKRFGFLTVKKRLESKRCNKGRSTKVLWLCKCDCGNEVILPSSKFYNGRRTSCGCFSKIIVNNLEFDSFPEAVYYLRLLKNETSFELHKEYPFTGINKNANRCDFYLPDSNTYVEVTSFHDGCSLWEGYKEKIDKKRDFVTSVIGENFLFIQVEASQDELEELSRIAKRKGKKIHITKPRLSAKQWRAVNWDNFNKNIAQLMNCSLSTVCTKRKLYGWKKGKPGGILEVIQ